MGFLTSTGTVSPVPVGASAVLSSSRSVLYSITMSRASLNDLDFSFNSAWAYICQLLVSRPTLITGLQQSGHVTAYVLTSLPRLWHVSFPSHASMTRFVTHMLHGMPKGRDSDCWGRGC